MDLFERRQHDTRVDEVAIIETDNLVLEQLRLIRKEIAELKDGQAATRLQISAVGQQVAGLTTAVYAGHDRFAVLEQRIERRLEPTD